LNQESCLDANNVTIDESESTISMQPVEYAPEPSDRGNEDQKDVIEHNETLEAKLAFEKAKREERRRRRQQIHDALMARDVKDEPMDYEGIIDQEAAAETETKTFKIRDLMTPMKRAIKLPEVMKMDIQKPFICEPFPFQAPDPFDDFDAPSVLDVNPHIIPECLAVRQSYTTKYLRGIQRCLKENVYDYRATPEFDPLFPDPDPEIPSLAEAIAREKEEKIRLFRREQVDKDRERMPPPALPIPQTPSSTSEDSNSSFPNGQSSNIGNNNPGGKEEM
jgi:hypothetical protein